MNNVQRFLCLALLATAAGVQATTPTASTAKASTPENPVPPTIAKEATASTSSCSPSATDETDTTTPISLTPRTAATSSLPAPSQKARNAKASKPKATARQKATATAKAIAGGTYIHFGTAKVIGKVTSTAVSPAGLHVFAFTYGLFDTMFEQPRSVSAPVKSDGSYELDVPLGTLREMGAVHLLDTLGNRYTGGTIIFDQQHPLHIGFRLAGNGSDYTLSGSTALSTADSKNFGAIRQSFLEGTSGLDSADFRLPPADLTRKALTLLLPQRLTHSYDGLTLSPAADSLLRQSCRLIYAKGYLLFYKEMAARAHVTVAEPPFSYYAFLHDLDLRSPLSLPLTMERNSLAARCTDIAALRLPSIRTTPTKQWIDAVGRRLAPLTGFAAPDPFYEQMALQAYVRQLREKSVPLTPLQRRSITAYYTGPAQPVAAALLGMNETLEKTLAAGSHVRPLPAGEKQALLDSILAQYPGRAVLIDFWNTWCMPCMAAHEEMTPLKQHLDPQSVAFVYLANESSPRTEWEQKIKSISGDHYYLPQAKYTDLLTLYKAEGIPFYLLYDRQHRLVHQSVAFPGREQMEQWLREAAR